MPLRLHYGRAWLAALGLILLLPIWLALGCGRSTPPTPVLHSPEVSALELVSPAYGSDGTGRALERVYGPPRPEEVPPPGAIPSGYRLVDAARGREAWALGVASDTEVRVLLFDLRWKPMGEIAELAGIKRKRAGGRAGVWLAWDSTGRRLAVMRAEPLESTSGPPDDIPAIVGVAEVASLAFHVVASPEVGRTVCFGWPTPGLLIVHYDYTADHNRVLGIDPATGKTDVLYDGARDASDGRPMMHAALSPDGSLVAFSRDFDDEHPTLGVWLLSLATGKATEITSEPGGWYHHTFLEWDDEGRILFERFRRSDGQSELYRATLRVPPGANPS